MISTKAKKYGKAFFETYEADQYAKIAAALNELSALWEQDSELKAFFTSPSVNSNNKVDTLKEISQLLTESENRFTALLQILLDKNLLNLIPEISEQFNLLHEQYQESMQLEITTASAVSEEEQASTLEYLKETFGPQVKIKWKSNPQLIGGFTVLSGDKLLDSSVTGALAKFKQSIKTLR